MKKKNTSDSLEFARRFIEKELPRDIINDFVDKVTGDFENEFPLNHVYPQRKADRVRIWQEIDAITGGNDQVFTLSRTALITFLNFHLPFSAIIQKTREEQKDLDESEQKNNAEIVKLREFLPSIDYKFEATSKSIRKEIKFREVAIKVNTKTSPPGSGPYEFAYDIESVIDLYRAFRKATQSVDLQCLDCNLVQGFLGLIQQKRAINITHERNPSDLPFRALMLIVFASLWHYSGARNKSATLTAGLLNEYAFRNTLLKDISQELKQDNIVNLWKASMVNGEFIRGRNPRDIFNFQ